MIGSKKYQLDKSGQEYYNFLQEIFDNAIYKQVPNPCGEITLKAIGGYCIISDLVPYFSKTLQDAKEIAKLAPRFLIRTNLMDCLYSDETKRTNRIGVGLTGIHEFAWDKFKFTFYDLIDEQKSQSFWNFIAELRDTVIDSAINYSKELGVNIPHTMMTAKPSGSISKLFALTEGIHLPAMRFYLRNVQFQNNDPKLEEYRLKGYPVRELKSYPNISIVGFPTQPLISKIMPSDKIVTASEATPEQQYKWLMLFEKYWLGNEYDNQLSYTMKFNKNKVSLEEFKSTLLEYQSKIKCCSVMPDIDQKSKINLYEYLPEEEVTEKEFLSIVYNINDPDMIQDIDLSTLLCSGGSCPL